MAGVWLVEDPTRTFLRVRGTPRVVADGYNFGGTEHFLFFFSLCSPVNPLRFELA